MARRALPAALEVASVRIAFYQQTFRVEADELIGEIEIVILVVEDNPDDADAINRLYRAVAAGSVV